MWQALAILHKNKNSSLNSFHGPVWKTCLREIYFCQPQSDSSLASQGADLFRGLEAYQLLLEICAGLKSPLVGETEVFGQFREFRASQKWEPQWIPFLESLEEDTKKIRREFLSELGPQSYGSLVRRHLVSNEPIVLLGTGRLAEDIFPWVKSNPVEIVSKSSRILPWVNSVQSWADFSAPQNALWIIASPYSNEELSLEKFSPRKVLDFRGEATLINPNFSYLSLTELFGELAKSKENQEQRKLKALQKVDSLLKKKLLEVVHRPYGWEDFENPYFLSQK